MRVRKYIILANGAPIRRNMPPESASCPFRFILMIRVILTRSLAVSPGDVVAHPTRFLIYRPTNPMISEYVAGIINTVYVYLSRDKNIFL